VAHHTHIGGVTVINGYLSHQPQQLPDIDKTNNVIDKPHSHREKQQVSTFLFS